MPVERRLAEAIRIDVWLWRARLFRTRALAARAVAEGRIRLGRGGETRRLDKPSRPIRPGDELVFARAGRLMALRVAALGERRGPPAEARLLYAEYVERLELPLRNGAGAGH